MIRFCPYCGKQLSERSKFCPRCGKASPQRQRHAGVAFEEALADVIQPRADSAEIAVTENSARETRVAERAPSTELARPRTRVTGATARSTNGSAASGRDSGRRYAPPTHALVGHHEQAGFGLRYGAWMFDFLIILIAMMGFTFAVTAASRRSVVNSNTDLLIVGGLTLLLFLINFVVLAGLHGQSLGMRILGIYIVRVDGRPFTIKDALVRHVVGYPLSVVVLFLGFLWMLWDPRQQGWHDKLARTMVVMSR